MLSEIWKDYNLENVSVIDSFPVSVCEKSTVGASNFISMKLSGYQVTKKRYSCGLKFHLLAPDIVNPLNLF